MYIIELESSRGDGLHHVQSQSHRRACWLEGYVEIPPHLVKTAQACGGYCDLTLEKGALTAIIPRDPPNLPQEIPVDPQADTDAMLVDLELRLTLLELEVI